MPEGIFKSTKTEPEFSTLKSMDSFSTEDNERNTIPAQNSWSASSQQKRLDFLSRKTGVDINAIAGEAADPQPENLKGNIENFIGMTRIPTGIVGPLQVHGSEASGDYFVPMATSEGALVASYNRGARATMLSGGVVSLCLLEALQRAPVFKFSTLSEAILFGNWAMENLNHFKSIVEQTSRFAVLKQLKINIEGNVAILIFEFTTGEASGQNMVTICTNAVCQFIVHRAPTNPDHWFIEGNFSGDKKATATALSHVRGKKVSAEAVIPQKILKTILNTTASKIAQYWITSVIGTAQSGGIGLQGHFANGLTAMFLATGQDVACVAESYIGITRMEVTGTADLYISVTLPGLMVGTIGGGTWLPTARNCLDVMGCSGPGSARKLAEIMTANILCGELSIAAAMASQDFARAHKLLGRKRK